MYLSRSKGFFFSLFPMLSTNSVLPLSEGFYDFSLALCARVEVPFTTYFSSAAEETCNSWIPYHSYVTHLAPLLYTLSSLTSMELYCDCSFNKILIPLPLLSYSLGKCSIWLNLYFCLFNAYI